MKKKIAIWMPGGIGSGVNSQGVPTIALLVDHFAKKYDVVVYMYSRADNSYEPSAFKLYFPPDFIGISSLRWLYLIFIFAFSHFKKSHSALLSFWGYPSGTIVTLLAKIFRKSSVVFILGGEAANLPQINYGLMRKSFLRKIILWTCHNCTKLICVSQFQVNQLKSFGLKRDAVVIPWGADKNLFWSTKRNQTSSLKLIHIANLNAVKDQSTLIKAFALIRKKIDARLKIVGPDFLHGKIQALVTEMNLNDDVEFTDGVPYEKIPGHLASAELFVLTSLTEGQNNSITEAMACGLLCASTRVGIMHDLGDDFGIVVEVNDYESLAKKIIEVATHPEIWQAKIKNSLAWSQAHDFAWTTKEIDKHLSAIIKS